MEKFDDSLRSLFPEKRIAFQEVISEILTGDLKSSVKLLTEFAGEQMLYLLQTGKKNLVHILLIAMIAAFMNQFAGTLQNRQVASVGFYMIYILLAALTVAAFDVVIQWVEPGYVISRFYGSVLSGLLSGSCGGEGKCDRSGIL